MSVWRQRLVFLLLVAYAGTGPLLDLIHGDTFALPPGSVTTVDTHGCKEKEKHVPLDRIHQCAVCAQSAQRFAVPVTPAAACSPVLHCMGTVVHPNDRTTGPLFSPAHPRGPPAA
jgi:hypothetical protein